MPFLINDQCVECGLCPPSCPFEAIAVVDGKHKIDEAACVGCTKCVPVCPVSAIVPK
ncbi:MAG: 4Fe-4S binding protein [Firmicutes bacterium]|nr:4Fe-4S binding protein [Bacillota bacterium]